MDFKSLIKLLTCLVLMCPSYLEVLQGNILFGNKSSRKAMAFTNYRWTNGSDGYPVVPYQYGNASVFRSIIEEGLDHWRNNTCLKFIETSNSSQPHIQFIQAQGCWSKLGMQFSSLGQPLSIVSSCAQPGIVTHELGHALGMYHEQSRTDRDYYVKIIEDTIQDGHLDQFNIQLPLMQNNYSIPYDYSSIMHYGSKTYSKNNLFTIETLDPLHQGLIGQREQLSHYDKLLANTMYPCRALWLSICKIGIDPCQNYGYLGEDCACVCPAHTRGEFCQNVVEDYYDQDLATCSEIIKENNITLMSSGNLKNKQSGERCVKLITAPNCFNPQLTIIDFHLRACYLDTFIISLNHGFQNSSAYCKSDLKTGRQFISEGRHISIFSEQKSMDSSWEAQLLFIPDPTCKKKEELDVIIKQPKENNTLYDNEFTLFKETKGCTVKSTGESYYWTNSKEKESSSVYCEVASISTRPAKTAVKFHKLKLDNSNCSEEFIQIIGPHGMKKRFCGKQLEDYLLPSSNFKGAYFSNINRKQKVFNISFAPIINNCHKIIKLKSNSSGNIKLPKKIINCEWWIQAPEGLNIEVEAKTLDYHKSSSSCSLSNYVVIDYTGDPFYPYRTSKMICGLYKVESFTSTLNLLNIIYVDEGYQLENRFHITYKVI